MTNYVVQGGNQLQHYCIVILLLEFFRTLNARGNSHRGEGHTTSFIYSKMDSSVLTADWEVLLFNSSGNSLNFLQHVPSIISLTPVHTSNPTQCSSGDVFVLLNLTFLMISDTSSNIYPHKSVKHLSNNSFFSIRNIQRSIYKSWPVICSFHRLIANI